TAERTKTELVNRLGKERGDIPWRVLLDYVCTYVVRVLKEGEPVQRLSSSTKVAPLEYLVYPFLPKNVSTVLFGTGGSLKSYVATLIALCVTKVGPAVSKELRVSVASHVITPLFLDWETEPEAFNRRMSLLQAGLGIPGFDLLYRRCRGPLVDEIEPILNMVTSNNVGMVVVDSMGMAAGGDISTQPVAASFFAALRGLGVTSLVITHESKNPMTKKTTPFGSVYTFNEARMVWHVEAEQEVGSQTVDLIITNTKFNDGAKHPPIAYEFEFEYDGTEHVATNVRYKNASEISSDLAHNLPLSQQITRLLRTGGRMTQKEIYEGLPNESQASIRARLAEMVKRGTLGKWPSLNHEKGEAVYGLLQTE
ncbi:MAG: AAA family ATPase, partial [Dehalococcoidales bacterium]|nr:AAA family ATPase [Dehalococcoidales bacterium]